MRLPTDAVAEERLRFTAFLGGLCLFFATVEYLFPRPLPFIRLGLANLPILLALELLPFPHLLLLALIKVLGQGLINGTLASYVFLFSFAGTTASVLTMYAVFRAGGRHVSFVGVSIAGALASNLVQIALSITFIFGSAARLIAPWFLSIGLGTGVFLGLFANWFRAGSAWYASMRRRFGREPGDERERKAAAE